MNWSVEKWLKARFPQAWRRKMLRRLMICGIIVIAVVEAPLVVGMWLGWW